MVGLVISDANGTEYRITRKLGTTLQASYSHLQRASLVRSVFLNQIVEGAMAGGMVRDHWQKGTCQNGGTLFNGRSGQLARDSGTVTERKGFDSFGHSETPKGFTPHDAP